MDRRAMATVRERRRLGKVRPEMKTKVRLDFVTILNRKKLLESSSLGQMGVPV